MVEGMGRDQMRASDADREQVVERLRTALQEGRLDLGEYDERMQRAYAAKVYADLDGLLTDLPVVSPPAAAATPVENRPAHPTAEWLVHEWQSWVPAAVVLTAIWAISGFGDYWPGWIIGIWAVALIWRTINGLMTGAPRRRIEEREARELKERQDKERRALEAERRAQQTFPPSPPREKNADMSGSPGSGPGSGPGSDIGGDTPDPG
jgi:Domain of unknown function (DUF1707)